MNELRAGKVFDERYLLGKCLGYGGMGSVWAAKDLGSGQRVALKALHEHFAEEKELVTRFIREARAAVKAQYSAHIIQVMDVVQPEDGTPYLVMEYLAGENLAQILEREVALDISRAATITIQTCMALEEVHTNGIIHRDIKPENIFVLKLADGSDWVKLLDFGVAKFKKPPDNEVNTLTSIGYTVGTPHYMAPEQASANRKLDHRVDVYSTGAVLYEMLTGKRPFEAKDLSDIMEQVIDGNLESPKIYREDLNTELEHIVLTAMAWNKEHRFENMLDFAEALEPFSGRESSQGEWQEVTQTVDSPFTVETSMSMNELDQPPSDVNVPPAENSLHGRMTVKLKSASSQLVIEETPTLQTPPESEQNENMQTLPKADRAPTGPEALTLPRHQAPTLPKHGLLDEEEETILDNSTQTLASSDAHALVEPLAWPDADSFEAFNDRSDTLIKQEVVKPKQPESGDQVSKEIITPAESSEQIYAPPAGEYELSQSQITPILVNRKKRHKTWLFVAFMALTLVGLTALATYVAARFQIWG